jgi:L-alanine-DL-glutamate epimerase-like enolase superfamily enzyme
MKITRVEVLPVDAGKVHVFVRPHADDGIVGVGEPSCVGKEQADIFTPEGCYAYIA